MNNKKGFTMVELLVVLVIVAILAAVSTPIYLANVQRSRASEAVSTMALIRQALRDYRINANTYFDIAADEVQLPKPPIADITLTTGALANPAGVDIDSGVARYFSNAAYTVEAAGTGVLPDPDGASNLFNSPNAVDFIITVDGSSVANGGANVQCLDSDDDDCATNQSEVDTYRLEMDNTGRVMISYDAGTTWQAY